MCGIVGYSPIEPTAEVAPAFARLFTESRVRGLHACGYAKHNYVVRSFNPQDIIDAFDPYMPSVSHTRYSLSGDWHILGNNQPLVVGDCALAFNGVIHMGTKAEFEAAYGIQCDADNDGEIFLRRKMSARDFILGMTGSFAGVWLEGTRLYAGRNARRPLWKCEAYGAKWYASTQDIFSRAEFEGMTEVPVGVE